MDLEKINLDEYDLVAPNKIEIITIKQTKFIDITVNNDNSFFVLLEKSNKKMLSHNCDGNAIKAGLINLFFTYWPDLFIKGKITSILSPLIEAKKKGSKEIVKFYTMEEYDLVRKNHDIIKYNKGLGSLSRATYKDMIMKPKLEKYSFNEDTEEYLEMLFGKKRQDDRKEWIR